LATSLASKFYNTGSPTGDLIAWLAAFAVGFIVRPFGALVFGYLGDVFGRKYTFLLTLVMMGVFTALVGCRPTYQDIGFTAGFLLIILRLLQGLAIGGEYGIE
jgi:MFS family permease